MSKVILGTSSWSEAGWAGVFYPQGLPAGEQLRHYATQFPAVEADVTYYRIPSRAMVQGWADKTPDDFILSAKFPRTIVHGGDAATPDAGKVLNQEVIGEDVDRFLDAMALLGKKCGPLVLQFPYFNRTAYASAAPFLETLDRFLTGLPPEFRYAVEVRNKSWVTPKLLDVLRRHRTALVLVDLAYMPHPDEFAAKFDILTTDFLYGRLIGDRKAVDVLTDRFDHTVLDQTASLRRWATLIQSLLGRTTAAMIFANNHYAGFAPETVRTLEKLLRE